MITQILAKVLPVLVMIALGRICATKGILNDDQHAGLKNIIGDILLPVVLFQAFFTAEYGRRMLRTVSSETVPMHERYAYRLKLTAGGNTSRRRVLLKSLPLPQAGAYLDAAPGLLRQVCRL